MAYRDEREALQARSRDLEQELERKRREVDELRRDGPPKERVEKLARDLAAAQWELARLRGTPPPRRVPVVVVALSGLIVALLLAGTSALMLMRTRGPELTDPLLSFERPTTSAIPMPPTTRAGFLPPTVAKRSVDPVWKARVRSTRGASVSVGAACEVSASLVSESRTQLKKLSVTCGKAELYATDEMVNGSTRTLWAFGEKAVSRGFQQTLVYDDTGKRQGRNQLSIDTPQGLVRVWAADDTPLEVVLAVDALGTVFPKAITPDAPPGLCAHVIRSGTVTEVAGEAWRGVKPGVRCQVSESLGMDAIGLEMGPEALGVDTQCRVRVSCGGTDLYAPGLGRGLGQVVGNEIVDQKPSAKDKDPMFRIAGDTVEVWDEGVSTWSVKIGME